MQKCAICGFQETDPNNKFCGGCGQKYPDTNDSSVGQEPPQQEPPQQEPPQQEPPQPASARILISSNSPAIDFEEHQKVIGRAELSNEIKMQGGDPLQVSRQHFTVYSESNKFYIADGTTSVQEKPSSNHTKVNGKDITGQGAIELNDGDQIEIATILTVTFQGPSGEGTPSNTQPPNTSPPSNNQSNDDIVNKYDNMPEL